MKKLLLFILFLLLLPTKSNAQRRFIFQHEVGAEAGISNFQGDFSAKGPLDGKVVINGLALSGSHYLHILPRRYGANPIYRHAILKTSIGINSSSLDNKGRNSTNNEKKLAKLTSNITIISLDNELQFYSRDNIRFLHRYNRYRNKSKVNPYIGLGFGINYINANPSHDYETEGYPQNYQSSYIEATSNIVLSANLSLGARYKVNPYYDLLVQMRFKYYISDWVDGVNPEPGPRINNAANDFNTTISAGFVYHMF